MKAIITLLIQCVLFFSIFNIFLGEKREMGKVRVCGKGDEKSKGNFYQPELTIQ